MEGPDVIKIPKVGKPGHGSSCEVETKMTPSCEVDKEMTKIWFKIEQHVKDGPTFDRWIDFERNLKMTWESE